MMCIVYFPFSNESALPKSGGITSIAKYSSAWTKQGEE
jgi:hypothetical protein